MKINLITRVYQSLFLLLLGISSVFAANDISAIYQLAKDNDPTLKTSKASRSAAYESRKQVRALLYPSVTLSASTSSGTSEGSSISGSYDDNTRQDLLSLTLNQPLYRKALSIQQTQGDATIAIAEANHRAAEQDLISRVADAYFGVLGAKSSLEFAQAGKKAIGRQLEQSKQRFQVGLIAITDVHEAQARYDLAVADEIAADNALASSREILREITGSYHDKLAPLQGDISLVTPDPQNIDEWAKRAVENNATVISALRAVDIAQDQVSVERSGHLPTLDLIASYSDSDTDGGSSAGDNTSASVKLLLTVPLYSGGGTSAAVRESLNLLEESRQKLETAKRKIERQTRGTYLGVVADISRVKALNQALTSNRTALEATEAGFEVGTRTIVDVLNAQQELFKARRDLSQARYGYIINLLGLKQAAGILSENDIETVNSWLGNN